MANTDIPSWIKFCSDTAPMAAFVVFMAPCPTIQQIIKDKSVGNFPLLPYSSMISNCFLWFVYGILTEAKKVWLTNFVGLVCGLFYFMNFIKYVPKGTVQRHITGCLAVMVATSTWAFMCYVTVRPKNNWMPYASTFIGNLAVFFCLLMFASPLSNLKTVLQTRSAKSLPLPFILATVLNCFLWSVAGLYEFRDFNIYFPNLLGLGFGLIQVALKIFFEYRSPVLTKTEDQIHLVA